MPRSAWLWRESCWSVGSWRPKTRFPGRIGQGPAVASDGAIGSPFNGAQRRHAALDVALGPREALGADVKEVPAALRVQRIHGDRAGRGQSDQSGLGIPVRPPRDGEDHGRGPGNLDLSTAAARTARYGGGDAQSREGLQVKLGGCVGAPIDLEVGLRVSQNTMKIDGFRWKSHEDQGERSFSPAICSIQAR